ncbi:MAG: ABC transporter ATP-binding protein [candidate division NC10 bacterium]|nr:ABC transporter ATP-binding protein [candidate division NC10 bacterium]
MASPAILLKEVTKRFPAPHGGLFTALREVSLEVARGEFVSLVGPSGCGKSTVLGLVAGLIPPTGGSIVLDGEPVQGISKKLGYLFQRDALLPWKTVLENVTLGPLFRGMEREEAHERAKVWIAKVGLVGFERYYPAQLSGGMRKRVALAQTLVYDPEILLMDEPFAALDVQTRNLMENELLELWGEFHKTVLFVTHDLEEAIALSDRVIVMTASPGKVKASYRIDLPRPRNVVEIRFQESFSRLYEVIWKDLKEEVMQSDERRRR